MLRVEAEGDLRFFPLDSNCACWSVSYYFESVRIGYEKSTLSPSCVCMCMCVTVRSCLLIPWRHPVNASGLP